MIIVTAPLGEKTRVSVKFRKTPKFLPIAPHWQFYKLLIMKDLESRENCPEKERYLHLLSVLSN